MKLAFAVHQFVTIALQSCTHEDDVKIMAACIQLDMECAAACYAAAQLMSLGSSQAKEMCFICAQLCDLCAEECGKHHTEHCKECAEACKKCADECRRMWMINKSFAIVAIII